MTKEDDAARVIAENVLRVPGIGAHPTIKSLASHTLRMLREKYPGFSEG